MILYVGRFVATPEAGRSFKERGQATTFLLSLSMQINLISICFIHENLFTRLLLSHTQAPDTMLSRCSGILIGPQFAAQPST